MFSKTPIKSITFVAYCPPKYPDELLTIQMTSKHLDSTLLRKLQTVIEKDVKAFLGKPQCVAALRCVQKIVEQNMMLSCWQEINMLRSQIRVDAGEKMDISEKSGTIAVLLTEGQYRCRIQATVPNEYPERVPELDVIESNVPASIWRAHVVLAQQQALILVGQFLSWDQHNLARQKLQEQQKAPPEAPSTQTLLEHKDDMKVNVTKRAWNNDSVKNTSMSDCFTCEYKALHKLLSNCTK